MASVRAGYLNRDRGSEAMFDTYRNKYENARMKREDGILEVALHSGGGPLVFKRLRARSPGQGVP
jgi:hypothetical protein